MKTSRVVTEGEGEPGDGVGCAARSITVNFGSGVRVAEKWPWDPGAGEVRVTAMAGQRPRRDPTDAFRFVADEGCLVVVPDAAVVHVLNPVAGRIYSLLDGHHDEDAIVRAVMEEFEVDEAEAREGYRLFVADLRQRGMLLGGEEIAAGPTESSDE